MDKKKNVFLVLLLLVVVIGGAAALYKVYGDMPMPDHVATTEQTTEEQEEVDYRAPDFTVYDGEGNAVRLSDFRGKPVVLNFWASWCGPCKMEMPDFQSKCDELEEKVSFMMVNATDGRRETVETAKRFVEDSGYTFPVYFDTDYNAIYTYGINAFPTTIFIDADGNLVTYGQGAMSAATLQQGIDMIMN